MSTEKGLWESWLDRIKEVRWGAVIIEKGDLSFGRLVGWIVFALMVWFWWSQIELPGTLVDVFYALLIYNGGKKLTSPLQSYLEGRKKKPEAEIKATDTGT